MLVVVGTRPESREYTRRLLASGQSFLKVMMPITRHLLLGMTALVCGLAAAQDGRSGEAVYRDVCLTCHAGKVDKAPQFADRAAWKPLLAEGQAVLTGHAWVGVRGMPA